MGVSSRARGRSGVRQRTEKCRAVPMTERAYVQKSPSGRTPIGKNSWAAEAPAPRGTYDQPSRLGAAAHLRIVNGGHMVRPLLDVIVRTRPCSFSSFSSIHASQVCTCGLRGDPLQKACVRCRCAARIRR